MLDSFKSKRTSMYLVVTVIFLLFVNISLGYLLMRQTKIAIITLMETRMLDISNTAAAMVDGDVLKSVTPADEGTEGYETIMRTLTYFQDNVDLKYIYCIRDMGDGTFTFGLDPTVEDPGEFGSPIVYTDALYQASRGIPSVDEESYEDAWGAFYSAYSPAYDSGGSVAGIIAVDFGAEWYNQQLALLTQTIVVVAILSLVVGGAIVLTIATKSRRKIESLHGRLNDLESTLLQEMGNASKDASSDAHGHDKDAATMDELEKQIYTIQLELRSQIAQMHGHAYQDGLTGAKSKQAYLETERLLNEKLSDHTCPAFAVVVCDVNGLKKINDTLGHSAGDVYLCKAYQMIGNIFSDSTVYRIGGDEFAMILTGRDYENRERLMQELHSLSVAHIETQGEIVSGGMAVYLPERDRQVHEVFERADMAMYEEKLLLKSMGATVRDEAEQSERELGFENIFATSIRKHILIADDIELSREMLGDLLEEDYDILYAADGVETIEMLRKHKAEIALLLLDLYMPIMSGREVLREMQVDEELMSIPVMVLTVDQEAELDCLKLGAMDFIPKPYPDIEIVKARIAKCIELSENRDLIRHTQRDRLTGLLNRDYFIRYVSRFDQRYPGVALDAVVCDINQFWPLTEQYGRQFGDYVLRSIGLGMKKLARKTGGIGCREEMDRFLLYCPHQEDYEPLLSKFLTDLCAEKEMEGKVSLRFGVYVNAAQETDVEKRFACALLAADSVKGEAEKLCGYYVPDEA